MQQQKTVTQVQKFNQLATMQIGTKTAVSSEKSPMLLFTSERNRRHYSSLDRRKLKSSLTLRKEEKSVLECSLAYFSINKLLPLFNFLLIQTITDRLKKKDVLLGKTRHTSLPSSVTKPGVISSQSEEQSEGSLLPPSHLFFAFCHSLNKKNSAGMTVILTLILRIYLCSFTLFCYVLQSCTQRNCTLTIRNQVQSKHTMVYGI